MSYPGAVLEIRTRNWSAVFLKRIFYRLLHCYSIDNVWEIWPIKIDFGRPNAEIGWEMANGLLLFLALWCSHVCYMFKKLRVASGSNRLYLIMVTN